MNTLHYFLGSAKFTWFASLFAFIIFISEDFFNVKRNRIAVLVPKFLLYQTFLFEIFLLKYKQHRLSITPQLVNISLRNVIVHLIFGLLNFRRFGLIVHFCWFLIDTFKFLHIIFQNRYSGFLKYVVSIPLLIFHGFFECLAFFYVSSGFPLYFRAFFLFLFLFHLISLEIVLKHKILQLFWYRKSLRNAKNMKKID